MIAVIRAPLAFLRLFYQSVHLALGQVWTNKTRSILTTIGIVIGVASVTAVIAAVTGLKTSVLNQVETLGIINTIVILPKLPDTEPLHPESLWAVRFLPEHFDGMLEHCPSVERFSRLSMVGPRPVQHGERSAETVSLLGIEPTYHQIFNRPVILGRTFSVVDDEQARYVCLIDTKLRDKLRLDRDCIGQSILIGYNRFRVAGVIEWRRPLDPAQAGPEYCEVFIPFRTAFKLEEPLIAAVAAGKSTEVVEEAQAEIRFFLRQTRNLRPTEPDTFQVESVKRYLETFDKIALIVTLVAGGIVGISLLVGGVGVMNIMLVSVSERTREIGLRKAVGAKKTAILTQFLVESLVLCFIGGIIGIGFGQLLALAIANIPKVELGTAYIPAWAVALSLGFTGCIGIFFGMFPAVKAARLDPIEALRHE